MKSFLLKGKVPIVKWSHIPNETYFEGDIPEGFSLAVSPSEGYIVIDVDRHGDINGFDNIPKELFNELESTLQYNTKHNGCHYWFKYTGNKPLGNKTSGLGIDLRLGPKKELNGKINNGGYVVWYLKEDPRLCMNKVKESSKKLNMWLESLFSYK